MFPKHDPELDLDLSRIIKAPRAVIWKAWTDPRSLEQWWVPAPSRCKVLEMEPRPGGALVTHLSENGGDFVPHMAACFLEVEDQQRIVFTNALLHGYRPARAPFLYMTAIITLKDHPQGTEYGVHVMHRDSTDRNMHKELGFHDGWGTVTAQLAMLAERQA
jgi:uncharacterized protein YndB with AHSA1/START domain